MSAFIWESVKEDIPGEGQRVRVLWDMRKGKDKMLLQSKKNVEAARKDEKAHYRFFWGTVMRYSPKGGTTGTPHYKVLFDDETTQDFSLGQLQTLAKESVTHIQDTYLDSEAEKRFWAAENKMDKSSERKATPKKARAKKSSPKKAKAKAESQSSAYKGGGKAPKNQLAILPARDRPPESASTSSSTSN
jgi:hypothetical protein